MQVELLIRCRWLALVQPEGYLEYQAIAIDQGRIKAILPIEQSKSIEAKRTLDRLNHLILPGLINAHTHSPMSLFSGLADDLPLMSWLNDHIWPAEKKYLNESFIEMASRLAIATMIRSGTTCFNDMYFFPEITGRVADQIGMRAVLGRILIDFPSAWAKNRQDYLQKGDALADEFQSHPLIKTILAPHAPYSVSDESLRALIERSDRIHIHLHETKIEIEHSLKQYGQRPFSRLQRLGLIDQNLIAVHMTQLNEAEIDVIAATGAHIVHCPESNLKLASGFCPAAQLIAAGIHLALGTDGAASNNDLDMIGEMRSAALLGKGVAQDASALPAFEVLKMATLHGAQALGWQNEIGTLAVEKSADMIAVDLSPLETCSVFDPIAQLVYAASREQVSDVWIAGQIQLENRQLKRIDEAKLKQDVKNFIQIMRKQN